MNRWQITLALAGLLAAAAAEAQQRPYIGFAYPAGGQQGTTVRVRMGGQNLDGVHEAVVSGSGVTAKVAEYRRRLNNQESQLLREQLNELRRRSGPRDEATEKLMKTIQDRIGEVVQNPACASLSSIVLVDVTFAPDAEPGPREIALATPRGVSNPLAFHVGQLPEVSRKPMAISVKQVLGKEEFALRKRPDDEIEQRIALPCTANGQIASGEVNRYRFEARAGQKLVISAQARQLVPYIADAVPGWFQPVMVLHDAKGKELAYSDDYRFMPDPVIFFEAPRDGEYVLSITDAIYRGREDFVYRVSLGELPFVTGLFPLGGQAGAVSRIEAQGWNLAKADVAPPPTDAGPGVCRLAARGKGLVSNRVPFVLDSLPECFEQEPNGGPRQAQKVALPVIVNGRIDRPDDWDVFQFEGREGDTIVAEVTARRLESPLDSVLKLTDGSGKLLAVNDDREDPEYGINTHPADSYLTFKLPADGTYLVHLGDAARHGGPAFAYRLRISPPRPDFALYVVPSSGALRGRSSGQLAVQAVRKDGFDGPIKLGLKDPPKGFSAFPVTLAPNQTTARLGIRTDLNASKGVVSLEVEGRATVAGQEIVREAVPAEDRMQAFLWRHLVPAEELHALVFDPSTDPFAGRGRRMAPPKPEPKPKTSTPDGKAKFTKQQVAGRLRQLERLLEDGLLTRSFYDRKVAECEAAL